MNNCKNSIPDSVKQLKYMTKFLMLSIKNDKNLSLNDVYDFVEKMDSILIDMSDSMEE